MVLSSGQTFTVEPHESILEAAIRAGVPLDYGCTNGTCGLCQARVVEGQVQLCRHQDYTLPEAQKAQGYALMCTHTPAGGLVIDAPVAGYAEHIPLQALRTKVRRIETLSDELIILQLQTQRSQRLRFLAGQYATFKGEPFDAFDLAIASCPCDDRRLDFHVRRVADEPFSEFVFTRLKAGDWLELEAPKGEFTFREGANRALILIAFDTGFAPIKSLLEHITAQESDRLIHLYWIACGKEGQYLNNLARSWADALDEFTYTPLNLEPPEDRSTVDPHTVMSYLKTVINDHPDLSSLDIYMSAPPMLLDAAWALFTQHGMLDRRFFTEPIHGNQNTYCLAPRP